MSAVPASLSKKLKIMAAAGASAVALAATFGAYYEGTGPTRTMPDGSIQYKSYRDTGGIWTVCHGVTGSAVLPNKWYTQEQCNILESKAYSEAEKGAKRLFPSYGTLTRWQQVALIDMVYNVGESAMRESTLRRKLNTGDIYGACDEMDRWVKGRVDGILVTLPGLVKRRTATEEICAKWKD